LKSARIKIFFINNKTKFNFNNLRMILKKYLTKKCQNKKKYKRDRQLFKTKNLKIFINNNFKKINNKNK
jgi:hypothetical protein